MPLPLSDDRPPIPPDDLILRVAPSFEPAQAEVNRQAFDLLALTHLECFERALALTGHVFTDFDRLLDFGCGCGRLIRHFGTIADRVEVHGTDIDAEMIDWMRRNVRYGHFTVAPPEPPAPYPDGYFDLVINHSVFTHLDARMQDLWLGELQRITQPDALLLLTVEGTSSWNRLCDAQQAGGENTDRWRGELESRGILFIADDHFIGSTHPDFYHSTFHAPWYVLEHWTRWFELVAYVPDGSDTQDLIMMRRRADGARPSEPIRHAATATAAPQPESDDGALAELERLAQPLPAPRTVAGQAKRRLLQFELAQQQAINEQVLAILRTLQPLAALNPETLARELGMMRAGLYEQGNRISLIALEMRGKAADD